MPANPTDPLARTFDEVPDDLRWADIPTAVTWAQLASLVDPSTTTTEPANA